MRATLPLFRLDPGWPYVLAGLALFAAGVLIPAHNDLRDLRAKLELMRHEQTLAYARLKAYTDFITAMDDHDPVLVRRLAAAQLNMIPQGQRPVLQAESFNDPVKLWVESSVAALPIDLEKPRRVSPLAQWASGPHRLWLLAAAAMSVFVGLVLGPAAPARRRTAPSRSRSRSSDSQPIRSSSSDAVRSLPISAVSSTALLVQPTARAEDHRTTSANAPRRCRPPAAPQFPAPSTRYISAFAPPEVHHETTDQGSAVILVQSGLREDFDVPEANDARPPNVGLLSSRASSQLESKESWYPAEALDSAMLELSDRTGACHAACVDTDRADVPESLDSIDAYELGRVSAGAYQR